MTPGTQRPTALDHIDYVIENRRDLFFGEPSCAQVLALVTGIDVAWGRSFLRGFPEWLVVQHGSGRNIHWSRLAELLAAGLTVDDRLPEMSTSEDQRAALRILEIVREFIAVSEDPAKLRAMYRKYESLRGARDPAEGSP